MNKKNFFKELVRTPDFVGFSTHWIWIWCIFWSSLFYNTDIVENAPAIFRALPIETLWATSLSSNVVTLAALLLLSHRVDTFFKYRSIMALAAIITSIGTVLLSDPLASMLATAELAANAYILGGILTGIGSAIIVVLWGEHFTALGMRKTIDFCAASFIAAAPAYFVIGLTPTGFAQLAVSTMPIVSMLCLKRFRADSNGKSGVHENTARNSRKRISSELAPIVSLVGLSLFFGVSFGIMKGLLAPAEAGYIHLRDLLNIPAIVAGSIAVVIAAHVHKMSFDRLIYRMAMPIMALGFLFLPLSAVWGIPGTALHQFGYQYSYIVLWAIWPFISAHQNIPAARIACWGMFSIQLGQLIGSTLGAIIANTNPTPFDMAMLAAFFIFVILLSSLFAIDKTPSSYGWGLAKPGEEISPAKKFNEACAFIVQQCKLSPRESEVFLLLAKGRNRPYICDELTISTETAKTHIKNVYRKIDVHSHQELLDMVEKAQQKSLESRH